MKVISSPKNLVYNTFLDWCVIKIKVHVHQTHLYSLLRPGSFYTILASFTFQAENVGTFCSIAPDMPRVKILLKYKYTIFFRTINREQNVNAEADRVLLIQQQYVKKASIFGSFCFEISRATV